MLDTLEAPEERLAQVNEAIEALTWIANEYGPFPKPILDEYMDIRGFLLLKRMAIQARVAENDGV